MLTKGRQPLRRFFNPATMPDFLPNAPAERGGWPERDGRSNNSPLIRKVSATRNVPVADRMASDLSVKQIKALQTALNAAGITGKSGKPLEIDGDFGPLTASAVRAALKSVTPESAPIQVRALQASLNAIGMKGRSGAALEIDGEVGPETLSALGQASEHGLTPATPAQAGPMSPIPLGGPVPSLPMSRIPPGGPPQPGLDMRGSMSAGPDMQPSASGEMVRDSLGHDSRIHGPDPFMASARAGQDQQPTGRGEFIPQSLGYDSRMHGPDPFMAGGSASVGQPVSASAQASGPINMTFPQGSEVEAHPLDRLRIAAQGNPQISPEIAQAAMARARQMAAERDKDAWWKRPAPVGEGFVSPFGTRSPELASSKVTPGTVEGILARLSAR